MRRALISSCLSVVLSAVVVSSASAATFNPPFIDFGKQPRVTRSAPKTFTVTKEASLQQEVIDINVVITKGSLDSWQSTSNCPQVLTAAAPTCTVSVRFTPFMPGFTSGTIYTDYFDPKFSTGSFSGVPTRPCVKKKQTGRLLQYKKKCRGFPRYLQPDG